MGPVQAENTLLEINGERIVLDSSSTGADVYRRLWCVTSRASLATPYELTFRRHDLAQASAKIVPFARRKDVQDAQLAQLAKIEAQEAALPIDIRRKKLFIFQQLDFEREHYLVAHVSGPLQQLQTSIMGGGQWQAYEYGKTMWYFHAPTARLCAQHPLRCHPEARELIERVQQQVQQACLMAVIQAEIKRREDERRKEQQRQEDAVRRVQRRIRGYQRWKRFLAMIKAAKRRQQELQREQQRAEERQREEQRAEENRQMELMKQERQRLQQELTELQAEMQQLRLLKETKLPVQTETQTSARRDESAIETLRKEEQQRLQLRLENLEVELQKRREIKPSNESETQTSSRSSSGNDVEQQRARHRIEELELQLRHRDTKEVVESETQTSGRRGGSLRDEGVDTGDDLEWQRYLTLLRVAVNKKKKTSPKRSRQTQTDSIDGEDTILASSMFRAPQHAVSFSPSSRKFTGEWKGFPSWQRTNGNSNSGYSSNSSSTASLITLKSSLGQFDELDTVSPPTRTFESFFAPDVMMPPQERPPPPLVEQPWRQDSTFLPLKSSRKMLEITPVHQPLHEKESPIRPMGNASSFVITPASSPTNTTKLPYITRRRKNNAS
ncbi:hypothetical protein PHYSODRAFT_511427 [Phytophthora sojae]|uniref:Uncharacterized protein n=1 Tax=Phytophthora sojae (strain P6497) TaxID=1094619 RepID=G4ZQZ5_PHYSP|nr:hypothetical protein PHYSODRAFT_511427 [Phytophthora sojae]EGZ14075.1 hypothetical protein PHYSODRAFT_511427 [Phytophthora sojae]|eukprot:XP_009531504.1 hypothetical protein PHYSODRAFT_511427 [Phytophthora sojae]